MNTRSFSRVPSQVVIAFFVGSVILAACSGRSAGPPNVSLAHPLAQQTMDPVFLAGSPIPDWQIDENIDPNLPPDERTELHNTMLLLPPNERRNVTIYKLDGRIFATRPELTARAQTYTLVPGTQNTYRDNQGNTIVGPPLDSRSGVSGIQPMTANSSLDCNSGTSTGAFRRVCSVAGYAGAGLNIQPLPCAAGAMATTLDTPYLMLGAWSPTGDVAVDSGLQYSPAHDWYTPFFRRQGGMQMNLQGPLPCWINYNSGRSDDGLAYVTLTLFSSTQFDVFANFVQYDQNGNPTTTNWSQFFDVPKSDGWTTSGNGEIWKRGTFLAQTVSGNDGSYFGWSSTNSTMFHLFNAALGTYRKTGGYVSYIWSPWQTYSGTGGYLNNPNDPNAVFVNYVSPSEEYNGINLCSTC